MNNKIGLKLSKKIIVIYKFITTTLVSSSNISRILINIKDIKKINIKKAELLSA